MTMQHISVLRRAGGLFPVALLVCAPLFAGFHHWTSNGPDGGQVWALAIDSASPDLMYAGTIYSGVSRSFDGGATWEVLDTPFSSSSVQALAAPPAILGTVYAGTYFGGFWKSVDAGTTWTELGDFPLVYQIVIDPVTPTTVYLVTGGLSRSLDGGLTWDSLPIPGNATSLAIHASAPDILYVATNYGVYKSVDGGASFELSNSGIPDDANAASIAIDPNVASTLYAVASGILYKSTNAGVTWTPTGMSGPFRIAIEPGSPSTLYAMFGTGLSWSRDGSETWTSGSGLENRFITSVAVAPGQVFAGTFGAGVFRSSDGATTWSPRTSGLTRCWGYGIAIDPTNPRRVIAALAGGDVARTSDAGETWQPGNTGLTRHNVKAVAIDPFVPTTMYAGIEEDSFCGASMFKSGDGGASWFEISGNAMQCRRIRTMVADPVHPETVLVGAGSGGLMRTDDGGRTWAYTNLSSVPEKIVFDPSQPEIVWAASEAGAFRSADGGRTFDAKNTGLEGDYGYWVTAIAVDPSDSNTLYASKMFGYPLYKSTDGGESWTKSGNGIYGQPPELFDVIADPVEANTLYTGGYPGVWVTRDGGGLWSPMNDGLGGIPIVQTLAIDAGGNMLHAGTWGTGIAVFQLHFFDVAAGDPFRESIDAIAIAGVTTGCGHGDFCPAAPLTRAQAAVWLLRARHGSAYTPPLASGAVFADVPANAFAAAWIEALAGEGIAAGCGGGLFCPDAEVTRAQLAVWLLRAEHGSTYEPPPATGTVFADVPADSFAAAWIEQLAAEEISSGCGGGNFCPSAATTRAQSAVLLVRTFGL